MRRRETIQDDRTALLELARVVVARREDTDTKLMLLGVLARADELVQEDSLLSSHKAMEFMAEYRGRLDEFTQALGGPSLHDMIEEGSFGNLRNALLRAAGEALSGKLSVMVVHIP